jgi:hypothetical protein
VHAGPELEVRGSDVGSVERRQHAEYVVALVDDPLREEVVPLAAHECRKLFIVGSGHREARESEGQQQAPAHQNGSSHY